MNTYYLIELRWQGNTVISEIKADNPTMACEKFKRDFPQYKLDQDGYAKNQDITYCMAVKYKSY